MTSNETGGFEKQEKSARWPTYGWPNGWSSDCHSGSACSLILAPESLSIEVWQSDERMWVHAYSQWSSGALCINTVQNKVYAKLFYSATSCQILLNYMSNNVSITNYVTWVLLKYSMQLSKNIKHVQTHLAMAVLA